MRPVDVPAASGRDSNRQNRRHEATGTRIHRHRTQRCCQSSVQCCCDLVSSAARIATPSRLRLSVRTQDVVLGALGIAPQHCTVTCSTDSGRGGDAEELLSSAVSADGARRSVSVTLKASHLADVFVNGRRCSGDTRLHNGDRCGVPRLRR